MSINRDILKEIFYKLFIEEDFNEVLKLAISGRECLKIFCDIILTAKKVTLFSDSLKITFPKFDCFFGYDEENCIPKFVWKLVASNISKLVIEQYSDIFHKKLINDLVHHQKISVIKIFCDIPSNIVKVLFWMPSLMKLGAPVDIAMKIFDSGVGRDLNLLTVIIGRGQLDLFREFLYNYRITVKQLKLKIQDGFVWDEVLTSFSTNVLNIPSHSASSFTESISTKVTNLKLYFDKFCEFPENPSNLKLFKLFEYLGLRFPSLKTLSILIQPNDWLESAYFVENDEEYSFSKMLHRLSKFRLNPAFYIELIEELSKQISENEWNFEIGFTWYGEANVLNENGPEVKLFKQVFGPFLKVTEIDETNSKWIIEKKFSSKKSLFLDLHIRKIETSKFESSSDVPSVQQNSLQFSEDNKIS